MNYEALEKLKELKDGKKQLEYIDLKSYENNKSWTFLIRKNIHDTY